MDKQTAAAQRLGWIPAGRGVIAGGEIQMVKKTFCL